MEVKYFQDRSDYNIIKIYIDGIYWKSVRSIYFEKFLKNNLSSDDFKKKFIDYEKKKILNISLSMLSKRDYLKNEWVKKMHKKLFPFDVIEEVYDDHLHDYFDEVEHIKNRISSYTRRGKGVIWIRGRMIKDVTISNEAFSELLDKYCSMEEMVKNIKLLITKKNKLFKLEKNKMIAFLIRRGFPYNVIMEVLF